ncbi:hypothetical protein ZWY2020_045329 [Hordeum vulgare]|nr:hypothetical protein ZWY2020_045329 [Hordeum vulgare]
MPVGFDRLDPSLAARAGAAPAQLLHLCSSLAPHRWRHSAACCRLRPACPSLASPLPSTVAAMALLAPRSSAGGRLLLPMEPRRAAFPASPRCRAPPVPYHHHHHHHPSLSPPPHARGPARKSGNLRRFPFRETPPLPSRARSSAAAASRSPLYPR